MKDNKNKPGTKQEEVAKTLDGKRKPKNYQNNKQTASLAEDFRLIFDYAPDGCYLSDLQGNFMDGNKETERITGYQKEELIGKNYFQLGLLTSEYFPVAQRALARNRKGLPTEPEEFVLQGKDKKRIEVEISTYPVRLQGQLVVLGVVRDISRRKKAEEALTESEEKYRTLINQLPLALALHDMQGNIREVNRAMEERYGYSREELLSLNIGDLDPDSLRRKDQQILWKKLQGGKYRQFESRHCRKDGTSFPVRISLSALELSGKKYLLGLAEDITTLKDYQQRLEKNLNAIIEAISKIMDTRDPYTSGHQQKVAQLATSIAQELRLPREQKEAIKIAAALHDIGKIGIPSEILTKPATLNEVEFSLIKKHPEIGYDILKDIDFAYPIAQIALQHQERMDGSGYPHQLKDKDILLEAKIIGVADVVEAMSSHRPYRPALPIEEALAEISKNKGILYETKVVEACIKLFKEKGVEFK
ncbi:MAG: PAS domain S-box protein [Candidatus Atribacteria bacterium]|nr:PAS domain S-box protein [Candidatus Atribacteria bacterium]